MASYEKVELFLAVHIYKKNPFKYSFNKFQALKCVSPNAISNLFPVYSFREKYLHLILTDLP